MTESILVALISGGLTLLGVIISDNKQILPLSCKLLHHPVLQFIDILKLIHQNILKFILPPS